MAFDNVKKDFGKEHIYIVDLLLKGCFQTAGVSPCLATETGDDKCFNTLETCNFLTAFSPSNSVQFFRFYQKRNTPPEGMTGSTISGIDPIPSLKSVSMSPAKIDLSGGLGVRASATCTFADHPHSDINVDKYLDDRTYIASERGSFWTKLRARTTNYENKDLRIMSGYLVDGVFDINNFKTYYYIVDKMTVTNGQCTIIAKDPLKLTSSKKAQAPVASTGKVDGNIHSLALSIDMLPAGVGDLEYPASGLINVDSEVMGFTRVLDTLTVERGLRNTLASTHNNGATVQLCLDYTGKQVDFIVNDLLTNYANIESSYIPADAWASEVGTFLSGLLSGIIVKPYDVFKLLKELAESMPHYLWWDERAQVIQLTALKGPPSNSSVVNMDSGIVAGTFTTSDRADLRVSTVQVNFGQFDPTRPIDEESNYQQSYSRVDLESIAKYSSNQIKTINSRWISNTNKAAALQLAALIGRRFSNAPRSVSFSLDVKDSDTWAGQTVTVNHRDIVDFTGNPLNTDFQLLSAKQGKNYGYTGLEFRYGDPIDEDEGGGDPEVDLVIFGGRIQGVNLRAEYDELFPAPDGTTKVKFIVDSGVIIGAATVSEHGIDTGSWPTGALVTLQINITSFVVGAGGKGGESTAGIGGDGGDAIILNHNLTLVNNGVVGGGGGGGGGNFDGMTIVGGGGGAGNTAGQGGRGINAPSGYDGTIETGGVQNSDRGGDGGDLGVNGDDSGAAIPSVGGVAGYAIDKNGFDLTIETTGSIRGLIKT